MFVNDELRYAVRLMATRFHAAPPELGIDREMLGYKQVAPWELKIPSLGQADAPTDCGNASRMPRTMLRYSIEKLPERLRQKYLVS